MHESVNYNLVWIFLIAGILIGGAMLYFAPKIMLWLDKRSGRKMKSRQPTGEKNVRRYKTF